MNYHYTESGLDHIWLEDGFTLENHPNYGELVSIWNVRGLHLAIGQWLIGQPRGLTGAEFKFLRTEMDLSQRVLGQLLGVTDQAIAKWEKARQKPVANKAAERLLRVCYSNTTGGSGEFATILDRITQLDAEMAEKELHLEKGAEGGWAKAA
jgi:putative transcriptional regulator